MRWFSIIATWFGLGLVPYAPGTFGSLGALPLAWIMLPMAWQYQLLTYFFALLLSYAAAHQYGLIMQNSDHRSIVCDEVCGLLPVLLFFSVQKWLLAFVIFRFFDIIKPWPISLADKRIKGALGCMSDDLLAGCFTAVVLYLSQ